MLEIEILRHSFPRPDSVGVITALARHVAHILLQSATDRGDVRHHTSHIGTSPFQSSPLERYFCQKYNKTNQVDENKPKYLHSNPDVKSQLGRTDWKPREEISNLFVENNISKMFTYFSSGPNKGFAGWIRLSQQVIGLRTLHVRREYYNTVC